jgi:hypothetical protein
VAYIFLEEKGFVLSNNLYPVNIKARTEVLLESARSVYKAGQKSISRTCPTPFGVAPNYIIPYGPLVSTHWPMVLDY